MPSEEEYLDQLLRGLMEPAKSEAQPEPAPEPEEDPEPLFEPEPEPQVEPEPEIMIQVEAEPEPEIVLQVESEPVIEELMAVEEEIYEAPVMQEPDFDVPVMEEFTNMEALQAIEAPEVDITMEDDDILKKMVSENVTIEDVLQDDFFAELEELEAMDEAPEESDMMSVEEIEQILAENQSEAESTFEISNADLTDNVGNEDADLMSLLEETPEDELQDIYDMLRKSDNNEVVDEDMFALLGAISETDEAAILQAELDAMEEGAEEESGLTAREKKAEEKKRLKAEKAEAKRAAKEAKKAEKEAKRAAKKATKEIAQENKEAVAGSVEAKESDVFEGIDELSTADMLDLQDLLAFGAMETPSEEAIAELQQGVQVQSRPKIAEIPEEPDAIVNNEMDETMSADMLEIDELLNLAGISQIADDDIAVVDLVSDDSGIEYLDEAELADRIPEKKKKGLLGRILDFLTETDEEEDEIKGTEDIQLSDENKNILEEIDMEDKASGKKKGKKDKKAKKGKKGKDAQAELETLGDDEEEAPKAKKAQKGKKSKKEKEKHLEVMPLDGSKSKLPIKAMISVGAICVSILAVILLLVNLGGDFAAKRAATKAYYNGDYETCYQTLYGRELNESQKVMYAKSESILRINIRMRQYEIFVGEKSEVEALDVLIQTVYDYAELYEYASKWNAEEEVGEVYVQMLAILQDKYHLTESDALEIAAEPDDVEYTRIVTSIAEGNAYHSTKSESNKTENLPDMLPEELNFPENNGGR